MPAFSWLATVLSHSVSQAHTPYPCRTTNLSLPTSLFLDVSPSSRTKERKGFLFKGDSPRTAAEALGGGSRFSGGKGLSPAVDVGKEKHKAAVTKRRDDKQLILLGDVGQMTHSSSL